MSKTLRHLSFDELMYNKQYRGTGGKIHHRPVHGLDTETFKGRPRLIADDTGEYKKIGNEWDFLNFLMSHRFRNSVNGFWNLDFDFRGLTKLLGWEETKTLYILGQMDYGDLNIEWIPSKYFAVNKHKHKTEFFDFQQFFHTSLERAGRKFLGEGKASFDAERLSKRRVWENKWDTIVKYCIKDSKLTAQLGEIMRDKIEEVGISFHKPFSSGYLAGRFLKKNCRLPKMKYTPWIRYAMNSYYGGRFEIFNKGYTKKAYKYDISSAYPAVMAQLPDFTRGTWEKHSKVKKGWRWGFVRTSVKDRRKHIAATPFDRKRLIIFPRIDRSNYFLTLPEYQYIRKTPRIDVKLCDAWVFHPRTNRRPFQCVKKLYDKKQEVKGGSRALYRAYKIIMNSCYGKTVETQHVYKKTDGRNTREKVELILEPHKGLYEPRYKPGQLTYPPIGALITGMTRVEIAKALHRDPSKMLATFTDCVITDRPMNFSGTGLGSWELETSGKLYLIATGIYAFKNSSGVHQATRGFKLRHYKNLLDAMRSNKDKKEILVKLRNPVTAGEIFEFRKMYDFEDLNRFKIKERRISVNSDNKRRWERPITSFKDILNNRIDSAPLTV